MAKALLTTMSMTEPDNCIETVRLQNAHVSYHITYYLLKESGIRLNGYATSGNGHSSRLKNQMLQDSSFRDAIETLETSCKQMKGKYQREIGGLVKTLDISDTQLYSNFQQSAVSLMDGDIRWGRIAVLVFFTSVLAERLHTEGQGNKINSLIGWLTTFLNENTSMWILEKGGWVSTPQHTHTHTSPTYKQTICCV